MALTRKDLIIAVIFSITLFGFIFWLIYIYPLQAMNPMWPSIKNPSEILQDCKPLLCNNSIVIEKVNWPESIKVLSPVLVTGKREFVDIRISGSDIASGYGYLIFPNFEAGTTTPKDYIIRDSVYPGILRYVDKKH